jgi:hypothetical protein
MAQPEPDHHPLMSNLFDEEITDSSNVESTKFLPESTQCCFTDNLELVVIA